jgi:hypothetical protein
MNEMFMRLAKASIKFFFGPVVKFLQLKENVGRIAVYLRLSSVLTLVYKEELTSMRNAQCVKESQGFCDLEADDARPLQ